MSTSRDRELRSDIRQIEQLLEALQEGTLQEVIEVPARFLESDEARLLNLVLLQRTINELSALRGTLDRPRVVGDPQQEGEDPVVALLEGDVRAFALERTVESGTPILDEGIQPNDGPAVFRLLISLDTATTVAATVDQGGQSSGANDFNEGTNVGAGQFFLFDLPGIPEDATVNYQTGADATANLVSVVELNAQAP